MSTTPVPVPLTQRQQVGKGSMIFDVNAQRITERAIAFKQARGSYRTSSYLSRSRHDYRMLTPQILRN
jgi:hypothetical protein